MKKMIAIFLAAAAGALASDPHMTAQEKTQLIQYLKDSRAEFVKAVANLSDDQWKWKPAPERWSVGECSEHILLAEGMLFARAEVAIKNPASPDWEERTKGKTELLMRVMAPRLGKAQAPEDIVPSGKMPRAEIMQRFAEVRAQTLEFVEKTGLPLKEHLAEHPFPIFNPLNAYQWVLYIPLHNMRHDKQIEEVKASPGFPSK
ncbi:MAG TPA: DinB family protein [Bryobacteraceae bacterium]|nr:DinB family protein [Bryobacteraceae bacterium]